MFTTMQWGTMVPNSSLFNASSLYELATWQPTQADVSNSSNQTISATSIYNDGFPADLFRKPVCFENFTDPVSPVCVPSFQFGVLSNITSAFDEEKFSWVGLSPYLSPNTETQFVRQLSSAGLIDVHSIFINVHNSSNTEYKNTTLWIGDTSQFGGKFIDANNTLYL